MNDFDDIQSDELMPDGYEELHHYAMEEERVRSERVREFIDMINRLFAEAGR
jgi:hypothetical protein